MAMKRGSLAGRDTSIEDSNCRIVQEEAVVLGGRSQRIQVLGPGVGAQGVPVMGAWWGAEKNQGA
jgi:hypothetical protein